MGAAIFTLLFLLSYMMFPSFVIGFDYTRAELQKFAINHQIWFALIPCFLLLNIAFWLGFITHKIKVDTE